jgi:hypothetical protein
MFIMSKEEVQEEVEKINDYLKKCLWMDFTLGQAHGGEIELFGAIDQTYNNYKDNYEVYIGFEQPFYMSSLFEWQMDTTRPFIQLATDNEINAEYRGTPGHYAFRINAEHYEIPPILIVARKITCRILTLQRTLFGLDYRHLPK